MEQAKCAKNVKKLKMCYDSKRLRDRSSGMWKLSPCNGEIHNHKHVFTLTQF